MNRGSPALKSLPGRRTVSNLVLGAGFALTGVGTVMLGVLLPVLSRKWGLRDDAAGFLFFLQFLGTSLGAVVTGVNRVRSLMIAYGLLTVSTCVLAFAGLPLVFVVFFCFGLGLGTAMTSTSLMVADRYREDCAAQLQRLNFAWAVGATTAPTLFLPYLRMATLKPLFFTLHGLFLALLIWVFLREGQEAPFSQPAMDRCLPQNLLFRGSLLPLVVLAVCAVGIEAALSGWLTTYSQRADPSHATSAILAISLFWSGITVSRLAFSTRLLAMVGRRRVIHLALWCLAASVVMLIGAHQPATIRVGSALAGLSLGPLYPLVLSFMLEVTSKGWIFAVGGAGAAIFPWLTGLLSAHYGSLRYGLVAPCSAALLMIVVVSISLQLTRPLPQTAITGKNLPV
jgi:FHS family glucose/mannose:H+ symporter-like MFS transporter